MGRQAKFFALAFVCVFLLLLGNREATGQMVLVPTRVTELAVQPPPGSVTLTLTWTAPTVTTYIEGEPSEGPASSYDVRYSTTTPGVTGTDPPSQGWWDNATLATGEPFPADPNTPQTWALPGLQSGATYYIALASSSSGGQSDISNVTTGTTTAPSDTTPPATITDLLGSNPTSGSVDLTWTAPGDDGNTGTAAAYDIRYSTSPITDANWGSATQVTGEPAPHPAGTPESFRVTGLLANTAYYFAIKTADEVPNWSALSNIAAATTEEPDTTPPGAVTDLAASHPWETSVLLTWTAPGDDGNTGTAASYDIRYYTSPISNTNWGYVTQVVGEPTPQPAGAAESFRVSGLETDTPYFFALKTADEVPLSSPLSNVASALTLPPSKIAFASNRGGTFETYVMDPDGTNVVQLTTSPAMGWVPSWSPDGSRIVFAGSANGNSGLYVMNSDGSNQTRLPNNTPLDCTPRWSPDGSRIAFTRCVAGSPEVYVMDSDGSNEINLTNNPAFDAFPSWSPDGAKIAFESHRDRSREIYVMNSDGSNQVDLTNNSAGDYDPCWSPDGSKIAFTSSRDRNFEIYVMNSDGGNPTRLTNNLAEDFHASWSPDGSRIAFCSDRDTNKQIYVMNSDGSGVVRLTNNTDTDEQPAWSPFLLGPDTTAPGAVSNLTVTATTSDSATLTWTAPADDVYARFAASQYDLRYSTSPINAGNFAAATQASGEPCPATPGTPQTFILKGLGEQTTYYFALRTADEVPNWSGLSNVTQAATLADTIPPSRINDLAAGSPTGSSVTLTWTAVGDDGILGVAAGYDVRYSTSAITNANWASATEATGEPTPAPPDTPETFILSGLLDSTTYYFAIKAFDDHAPTPNYSPLSNVVTATTIPDSVAPAAVSDLAAGNPTGTSVQLTWTAPGDDGSIGTAASYDIRYSASAITEANWAAATQASGEPAPQPAGDSESFAVTGLASNTTYYFALKAADEKGNTSAISNSPSATTLDAVPPAAITDLAAGNPTTSSIELTWTAPGDDGTTGTAAIYDIRYSTASITDANWDSASQATGEPTPAAPGTQQSLTVSGLGAGTAYYFAMKTSDEVPNWSALSNVATAKTLDTTAPAAITTLATTGRGLTSVALSWTAVGDDGNTGTATSYDIRYSTSAITAANWDSATQATGEPAPQAAGSAESFTVSGLQADTKYYFAIEALDDFNNAGALSNVVNDRTLMSTTFSLPGGWSMFGVSSLPQETDLPTWLGIAGFPSNQWRVARWSPVGSAYVAEPSTDPLLDAAEGKAFWLWLESAREAQGLGQNRSLDETIVVPLTSGWNQVAEPFADASVYWSSVEVKERSQTISQAVGLEDPAAAALVADYGWVYQGGQYQLVHGVVGNIHQIEPWEGLWIWASQDCDLVLSGQPRAVARAEHKSRSPNVQWLVRLEATAGDARDTDNYLGVADSAYQIVGPPQIPHFVDLRLISGGAGLAADLRAGEQANLAWDLEVETDLSDAPVSLAWPDLSQVPKGYRLTLYDLDANRAQQMRTTSGYVFNSGSGGIRHFRIEAKNAAAGVLLVANLAAQQTRGATSITYLLSQDAAVSVQIYSLAGNLVRDLAHNVSAVAGENSIVWDGRDDNGRLVPGGTYVCEVAASGEDGQAARASRLLVVAR